uniref:Uncharacterized protein n=1 Tax=Anguilla anguilla TaxID=7936 RepID=A0A0E9V247_ANGAN
MEASTGDSYSPHTASRFSEILKRASLCNYRDMMPDKETNCTGTEGGGRDQGIYVYTYTYIYYPFIQIGRYAGEKQHKKDP